MPAVSAVLLVFVPFVGRMGVAVVRVLAHRHRVVVSPGVGLLMSPPAAGPYEVGCISLSTTHL
ncbi:hypothetical protein BJY21_003276 [Kineosphaera limosa]|nr:hypothetical protein [Kineosphaera limosa]